MIGREEIMGALEVLNPRNDAVASIVASFGTKEAAPAVGDLFRDMDIDMDAIRSFGRSQLTYWLEEGDPLELASAKVDALLLGFNCGVAAARLEKMLGDV